jgi:hypothetical protein
MALTWLTREEAVCRLALARDKGRRTKGKRSCSRKGLVHLVNPGLGIGASCQTAAKLSGDEEGDLHNRQP